jgi:rhodanese-related sulfurtransferase
MEFERTLEFVSNHWILASGHFIVSLLLIQDFFETLTRRYKTVSATGAVALLNRDDALLIDVREPHEYAAGHIENARHLSLARLKDGLYEFDDRKGDPVIVYCQQGTRSKEACKQMVKQGFAQVYYLNGGMLSWEDAKLPVSRKKKK